jgi:amino acid adenylation domain-containing protein
MHSSFEAPPLEPTCVAAEGTSTERAEISLGADCTARLETLTGSGEFLGLVTLASACVVTLARYTRRDRIRIATPPRVREQSQSLTGLVPLEVDVDWSRSSRELLLQLRQALLEAYRLVPTEGDAEASALATVALEGVSGSLPTTTVPLHLRFRREPDGFRLALEAHGSQANTLRVAGGGLEQFGSDVVRTLEQMLEETSRALHALPSLAPAPPSAESDPSAFEPVHHQFEAWVERTPDAVALISQGEELSYDELNREANRIAHVLIKWGVGPSVPVTIAVERSTNMVISALAVLKAGGTFIPLDVHYPSSRLDWLRQDASDGVMIVDAGAPESLSKSAPRRLNLDTDRVLLALARDSNPEHRTRGEHVAYVTYTSGSTGNPNGVLTPHNGASNYIAAIARMCKVTPSSRVSQLFSFSWDGAYVEMFKALCHGASLCLSAYEQRIDSEKLAEFLVENRISVATATPSMVRDLPDRAYPDLSVLHFAGEKVSAELARRWLPRALIISSYGPTETTMSTCSKPCDPAMPGALPIGPPVPNTFVVPLDENGWEPPVHVPGEIHIGGAGLAPGYMNRPALTAKRFVPATDSGRLYRTGDLLRRSSGRDFEFVDRVDHQTKLNGLRVEPGEIEHALEEHDGVTQAVVAVRADELGRKTLVGYVQPKLELRVTELRRHLSSRLPSHMIPSRFVFMRSFPQSVNKKVDRKALPDPGPDRPELESAYVETDTPIERGIAAIWREVLEVDRVGADDNFFDLGGRSLHITRVMALIIRRLGLGLPRNSLEAFFAAPSIRGLAAILKPVGGCQASTPLLPRGKSEDRALSFSQRRLWFVRQLLPEESISLYNCPAHVRIRGPLVVDILEHAFLEVASRHDVWRTSFSVEAGEPRQVVAPPSAVPISVGTIDLSALGERAHEVAERCAREHAMRPFDLGTVPLLRVDAVRLTPVDHVLLATIDHIVFDGWSVPVLLQEIASSYDALRDGSPSPLPRPEIQFADYAAWQNENVLSGTYDHQLDYWRERLASLPVLELPTDRHAPPIPTFKGAVEAFELDQELTRTLKALAVRYDVTLFMVLLAGFKALLHRYTDQSDIVLSSPAANREHPATQELIGFFVNSLVLRTDLAGDPKFADLLLRVRESVLGALSNQDLPFDRLVEELHPERQNIRNPMFRVAFSLQNAPKAPPPPRGLDLSDWQTDYRTSKFDLVIAMTDTGEMIKGDVEYSTDFFSNERILQIIEHLRGLLRSAAKDPSQRLLSIPIQDTAEQARARLGVHAEFFDLQPGVT